MVGGIDQEFSPSAEVYMWDLDDPEQNRLLVYGGLRFGDVLDDLWELRIRE